MKNILITGGAGFIGANLSLKLLSKGYQVTVLDNLSEQIHGQNPENTSPTFKKIAGKVQFFRGTILDKELLLKAVEGQQIIVHLAAETGTGQSMYKINHYANVNVIGTSLLLDILANEPNNVEKVVVASSRSLYGEGKYQSQEGVVYPKHRSVEDMEKENFEVVYQGQSDLELLATDEDSKIHPSSVYGITKQVQEQLIMTVCPSIGIAPVAFRYQNVYGPGQSLRNPYTGILSIFSNLILSGKGINIFEDGLESRDFVFIDDVVDATILGIEKEEANGEIFNVGTGKPTTVREVAECLMSAYNKKVAIEISGNFRIGDIRHNYADLTKIERLLGYEPKVQFEEGLKQFANWVQVQEIIDNRFDESIKEMKLKGLLK